MCRTISRMRNWTRPRRDRVLRSEELHVPVWSAHRRGRDRPGDRQCLGRQFYCERRFRAHPQPDDRRRTGAWRARPGHRSGLARRLCLRQGNRPAADRVVQRLHAAARRGPAVIQAVDQRDAVHAQPARRQGLRRSRGDRRARSDHQRPRRCIEAARDRHLDMPATPERLWRLIQQHRSPLAAE